MKNLITQKFNHWQVNGVLKTMLRNVAAKESTRYAIQSIWIKEGKFIATDGRRLVVIKRKHKIDEGLYYVTQDGFLLPCSNEGRFPKYESILLKGKGIVEIQVKGDQLDYLFSNIVYHLNKADILFNLLMLQGSLMTSLKNVYGCTLKTKAPDSPFQLRFTIDNTSGNLDVLYVQMPISK